MKVVVGIAINAPKYVKENSEDFLLMDCDDWTEERKAYYEELNNGWDFFRTSSLIQTQNVAKEFL